MVLEGLVRVVVGSDGRLHVLHTEGPGGTLGEVPLFSGGRYPATAEAVEDCVCIVVDRETLARAIAADPRFAFRLLGRLANRVRLLINRLDEFTGRSVRARLANYLLARSEGSDAATVMSLAGQAAVAEEIGTVREVVVRELRWLKARGIGVAAGRGQIAIVDRQALEALARTD